MKQSPRLSRAGCRPLAVASKGFEREMGGLRLDRLNDDAGGSQKV